MLISIDAATIATYAITIIFSVIIICSGYFLYSVRNEKDKIERTLYILMLTIILGGSFLILFAIWDIIVFK